MDNNQIIAEKGRIEKDRSTRRTINLTADGDLFYLKLVKNFKLRSMRE